MKKYISVFLVFLGLFLLNAQTTKKALFIGNSYIYTNNLPHLIAQMANSTGDQLVHDSNTPGGYTLKQHSTNATTLSKINQGNWDFVILQDQSQYPSFPDNFVQNNVYPYAETLNEIILAANSCTETIFYATWGRKNGDQDNCGGWPPVCTYQGMDDLLQERYRYMADTNEAVLSPVAWVWRYIRTNHPEIELYSSDNSHPSLAGSYAAAATFYTVMFEKNPEENTFISSLSADTASKIRAAVKTIVWDDIAAWNVGTYNPQANFSYSPTPNDLEFQFENQSEYTTEYLWDFGDGNTSSDENPVHTYASNGTYTVKLTASNCGKEEEMEKILETELSVQESNTIKRNVYPNPVKDILKISNLNETESWNLYDSNGKLLLKGLNSNNLDMRNYPTGTYYLQIINSKLEEIEYLKILKK
jgi:PKD repeat protein